MAHKRKGQLSESREWAKHLRADGKRDFWKSERRAEKNLINQELNEIILYND